MSFFGVTFENQLLSQLDDGVLQSFLLSDGRLRGLEMSYNGSTLTVGAGYLVAAGRLIGNDAALPVTVPAFAGYARVVLAIDLTAAATESVFEQLSVRVDQSADGSFDELIQGDINGGQDTLYEVALVTVQTAVSGITGISSMIPAASLRPILGPGAVTAESLTGSIKMGTTVPTTATIGPGEIYLKYT